MKAERRHVSEAADPTALILGAQRVARVLDDGELMLCRDGEDGVEVHRMPRIINRDNCSRTLRDAPDDFIRIEIQRVGADVAKDRCRSQIEYRIRCSAEGDWRGNHL